MIDTLMVLAASKRPRWSTAQARSRCGSETVRPTWPASPLSARLMPRDSQAANAGRRAETHAPLAAGLLAAAGLAGLAVAPVTARTAPATIAAQIIAGASTRRRRYHLVTGVLLAGSEGGPGHGDGMPWGDLPDIR